MKVVHLSTYTGGGAGIAAGRLHDGLISANFDSTFLSLGSSEPTKKKYNYYSSAPIQQRIWLKLIDNFSKRKKIEQEYLQRIKKIEFQSELYTTPFTRFHLENHHLIRTADIIHFHWISGFVDFSSFFNRINKPIIWTLHDMNPFMGGFHYHGDYERNYSILKSIENDFMTVKRKAIQNFRGQLSIVSPSAWLAKKAEESGFFSGRSIQVIPNGINVNKYNLKEKFFQREELGLPVDKKIILFLSENINNKRKGLHLLVSALNEMDNDDILLITAGKSSEDLKLNQAIKCYGAIHDEEYLLKIITSADVMIIPSLEDNLPNIMLEAFACGTPVISFAIGGLGEHIIKGKNGILANEISSHALKTAIQEFLITAEQYSAEAIKEYGHINFSLPSIVNKYTEVYIKQ